MSCGLRAQIDELRAEVKALRADATWRHRWHERLGRGNMTEGKFYEMLAVKLRTAGGTAGPSGLDVLGHEITGP